MQGRFSLEGRVAVITGGGGLLGVEHGLALAELGAAVAIVDIDSKRAMAAASRLETEFGTKARGIQCDITAQTQVESLLENVLSDFGRVDILINNAANNPRIEAKGDVEFSRLEEFPLEQWNADLAVGITGAFLCSRVLGGHMAANGGGVILNVASDLAVIAPDQRIYRQPGLEEKLQPVKPVTYSVVKSALVGLTKYLATYWAGVGVRVNAISPGGVYNAQPEEFVEKLTSRIPMGRMARSDEYRGAIQFMCSEASSYMTGANVSIDGGRTAW